MIFNFVPDVCSKINLRTVVRYKIDFFFDLGNTHAALWKCRTSWTWTGTTARIMALRRPPRLQQQRGNTWTRHTRLRQHGKCCTRRKAACLTRSTGLKIDRTSSFSLYYKKSTRLSRSGSSRRPHFPTARNKEAEPQRPGAATTTPTDAATRFDEQ